MRIKRSQRFVMRVAVVATVAVVGCLVGARGDARHAAQSDERLPTGRLELLRAWSIGTAANDNLEGAAEGAEGHIYVAGNAGAVLRELPGGVNPITLGTAAESPACGAGFVMKLSADGSSITACAQFAPGILHATSVAVTKNAVYVGGYAGDGLEPLLKDGRGLMALYPLRAEQQLIRDGKLAEAYGQPPGKPDVLAGRPWLGRLGAPCVLRFSTDLSRLEGGTYLEGWQQVYDKHRACGLPKRIHEHFWQPIDICPLANGDIVVSHDGGYFRRLTEADRRFVESIEDPEFKQNMPGRLAFYDVCDYVSRLSPDLSQRVWKTDIYTPPTNVEVARKLKGGWPYPHYSNPRTHRMRLGRDESVWVCGWSATETSSEPWWSPFLWQLDPATGKPMRRLYEFDPMSGGGNRMGGLVADTAVLSVAVEHDGDLLTCLISDGGNTWMWNGPLGKKMLGPVLGPSHGKGVHHFWGQVHRVDGKTFEGLGGGQTGRFAWSVDVAGLPGKRMMSLGRWHSVMPWTPDAWWTNAVNPNPNAFVRVQDSAFKTEFWTSIPGVRPFQLTPISGDRYIIIGMADGQTAPSTNSWATTSPGGEDGFFAMMKWTEQQAGNNLSEIDQLWSKVLTLRDKIRETETRLAEAKVIMTMVGDLVAEGKNQALDQARTAHREADAAYRDAMKNSDVPSLAESAAAARRERDRLIDERLDPLPRFKEMRNRADALDQRIQTLSARLSELTMEEWKELGHSKIELQSLRDNLGLIRRVFWGTTPEIQRAVQSVKHREQAEANARQKNKEVSRAREALRGASKALEEARASAALDSEIGKRVDGDVATWEKELAEHKASLEKTTNALQCDGWQTITATLDVKDDAKTPLPQSVISLPPGHKRIRALMFGFMNAAIHDPYVRGVCAREGVAIVEIKDRRLGIFDYTKGAEEVLLAHIDALAAASNHPEVRTVPWITAGCSASTLTARNIAYWQPDRVICVISFSGGNLQETLDRSRSLKGVPILFINGEWEWCGPVGGIRPEYGRQTQWVMIRRQLLDWRARDPNYLVNLLVIAGADHAEWSNRVSRYTGLFIQRAIQARLSSTVSNPETPVRCLPVRPESGWLTDQDLSAPRHPAAPYASYGGAPQDAFWHFDRELAIESEAVHRGVLWLPDPTREHPVPADWPGRL